MKEKIHNSLFKKKNHLKFMYCLRVYRKQQLSHRKSQSYRIKNFSGFRVSQNSLASLNLERLIFQIINASHNTRV